MPNIGNLLRAEIVRISRRECRKQTAVLQNSSARHRRDIASLKCQLAEAVQALKLFQRTARSVDTPKEPSESRHRFSASGFRSTRHRLGLSARQMGQLLGVSEQTIYNWETKVAVPRRDKLPRIAEIRGKGKRAVAAELENK